MAQCYPPTAEVIAGRTVEIQAAQAVSETNMTDGMTMSPAMEDIIRNTVIVQA